MRSRSARALLGFVAFFAPTYLAVLASSVAGSPLAESGWYTPALALAAGTAIARLLPAIAPGPQRAALARALQTMTQPEAAQRYATLSSAADALGEAIDVFVVSLALLTETGKIAVCDAGFEAVGILLHHHAVAIGHHRLPQPGARRARVPGPAGTAGEVAPLGQGRPTAAAGVRGRRRFRCQGSAR